MRSASRSWARLEWIWGPLAAMALLWPGRFRGPLDGIPLDGRLEAVILGLVFPTLWWFHARFLRSRFARVCILTLLAFKALAAVAFVQDGWCVRFDPAAPIVKDGTGAPHSWDARADWRTADPECSAIVARSYAEWREFPVWFFNLPAANGDLPQAADRPPGAALQMTVKGYLFTRHAGTLELADGPDMRTTLVLADEVSVPSDAPTHHQIVLPPGVHSIRLATKLTGDRWRFAPLWDGADLWSTWSVGATVRRPSRVDQIVRPLANWGTTFIVALLMLAWFCSGIVRVRHAPVLVWSIGATIGLGHLASQGQSDLTRWSVTMLAAAVLLPMPRRLKNGWGAFLLVGVPWLAFVAAAHADEIGRMTLYSAGDDWWTFQRFAYRIYLQGYWLEGGQQTFWFQPLYRWIAGALHIIFGDGSVGEFYWDGACMLVAALFAYHVTRLAAGFRWGLVAAVTTLTLVMQGPGWDFIGRGLSEISSMGLISLAALFALRSRTGRRSAALAAGALATLGFYTRLNNLPMAFAVAAFGLPLCLPARLALRPKVWLGRISLSTVGAVAGTLCLGLLLFAWRTWHYTGIFSVFYGTQLTTLSLWQPGTPLRTSIERVGGSLMMVLTMSDPPRPDPHALPLLVGVGGSALALAGVKGLRELPLALVLFCLAACSGALVARGAAYPGRFSIHLIGAASAVTVCAIAFAKRPQK